MPAPGSEDEFVLFKKTLENKLQDSIPELTNIANDLRLTKSTEISELILKKLQESKNDEVIIFYFKLIDSILLSVAVPYNKKLSVNLSTLFKKKYLTMNNSNRQKLIELFEKWVERSNVVTLGEKNEDDLFADNPSEFLPKETLKNIESFLVKASLLHEKRFLQKQGVPKAEDLIRITDNLILFVDKALDKNYSDELYERLTFIKQIKNILQTSVLEEKTLLELDSQLKNLPEYAKSNEFGNFTASANDDRVTKFIEKSKNIKVEDLKQLLKDMKSLELMTNNVENKPEEEKSLQSIWKKDSFQKALENYNKKAEPEMKNQAEDDQNAADLALQKLPDLTMLSNINKDLQASKLSLIEFLNLNIQTNNFQQWSRFIQLLYRNLPEKCQICGKRFPVAKSDTKNFNNNKRTFLLSENFENSNGSLSEDLKKKIEHHMDMHYESTSKSNIITKLGIRKAIVNRTWYTSPLSKNDNIDGESNKQDVVNQDEMAVKKRKLHQEEPSDVSQSYVPVPSELMSSLNEIECEICKDSIKVSFVESLGEWCLLDCKETPEGYVHLSCLDA